MGRFLSPVFLLVLMQPLALCRTTDKPATGYLNLDFYSLQELNRETRKNLMDVILRELSETQVTMDELRPDLIDCQKNVSANLAPCLSCVRSNCSQRLEECSSQFFPPFPWTRSVSVTSDSQGVSVCTVVKSERECRMIMNPEGTFVRSISVLGDRLLVNYRRAYDDLGQSAVVSLVDGMAAMANRSDPDVISDREARRQAQLRLYRLNADLDRMGSGISLMMARFSSRMNDMMSRLNRRRGSSGRWSGDWRRPINRNMLPPRTLWRPGGRDLMAPRFVRRMNDFSSRLTSGLDRMFLCGQALTDEASNMTYLLQKAKTLYNDVISATDVIQAVKMQSQVENGDSATNSTTRPVVLVSVGGKAFSFVASTPVMGSQIPTTARGLADEIWENWFRL